MPTAEPRFKFQPVRMSKTDKAVFVLCIKHNGKAKAKSHLTGGFFVFNVRCFRCLNIRISVQPNIKVFAQNLFGSDI